MTKKEIVAEYFGRLQVITNAMRACDENTEDCKIVEKVLRTLTPRFDHIVVAIKESKDLDVMTIEESQNSLEAHEQRVNERKNGEKVVEQALQAKMGDNGRGRSGWRGRGRGMFRGRSGNRNGGRNSESVAQENSRNNGSEGRGGNQNRGRGRSDRRPYDKKNIML